MFVYQTQYATRRGLPRNYVEYWWKVISSKLQLKSFNHWYVKTYFNIKKLVMIQVNASGNGLGTEPLQDDGLVTF